MSSEWPLQSVAKVAPLPLGSTDQTHVDLARTQPRAKSLVQPDDVGYHATIAMSLQNAEFDCAVGFAPVGEHGGTERPANMVRNLVTIDDLSEDEILAIFEATDHFLAKMGDPRTPYRIRGRASDLAEQKILATLFYEASTRTRFSFETAMLRLGGHVLSSADPKTTSAAKGETLADTIRVLQNYADIVVMRHPSEGAVRAAADYSDVPVINAGDGGHEHPTQTLCDLYTLRREKGTLKDLNVLLWGDLHNGRTVHSLVYGLARFGARIVPFPAAGLGLPLHVVRRLQRDYDCVPMQTDESTEWSAGELPVDVVYMTPSRPHQRTLYTDLDKERPPEELAKVSKSSLSHIDACYVTRLQTERMDESARLGNYPMIDREFLRNPQFKASSVLHPLPRVSELGYDLDTDERAVYFKQAAYGVPVRMALIAAVLELLPDLLKGSPPPKRHREYPRGTVNCNNAACVTLLESERRYLRPRFWIIEEQHRLTLRCVYCEHEQIPRCVARGNAKTYGLNDGSIDSLPEDLTLFADEDAAHRAGFQPLEP